MKSHYENLGVAETATPDEIKKAYRAKAKTAHPDAGGSDDEFAPIAQAYEVLSDPQRKLLYDATGADSRPPIEQEAMNTLRMGFQLALAGDGQPEVIKFVRDATNEVTLQMQRARVKYEAREVQLKSKRDKFKSTDGVNLVHQVIDAELKSIAANLLNIEHQTKVAALCLEMLENYEEELPPPPEYRTVDRRSVWVDLIGDPRNTGASTFGTRRR